MSVTARACWASLSETPSTDRGDMAMVGTAAASNHLQVGQKRQELRVLICEPDHIAYINVRGRIQLGVTLTRSVGPQSTDAVTPGRSALQLSGEMTRMRAIDHVVGRVAACGLIDFGNGCPK